ncbi:TPA: ECF transporter S component [Candidatus Bathyarchaeota archaeon]|nr:ECF transporter S component [Candidatus Bathyarchaeota archaeon]HIJ08411.1 ECF transporter S component [Candidatus Bathyarchaeota archaeon]
MERGGTLELLESRYIHHTSVRFATLALLSALGAVSSVFIGYAGRFLSVISGGTPVAGQLLSGLHVFWLVLAAVIVKYGGSATLAGVLKGLIEALLFSHLGLFVLLLSLVEGLVLDAVLLLLRKKNSPSICLASGFSAASNVVVLQFLLIPDWSAFVYGAMYLTSFFSGLILGGFLALKVLPRIGCLPPKTETSKGIKQ